MSEKNNSDFLCTFIVAKGQIFISVDSLQNMYISILNNSENIIENSREPLEEKGFMINSSFVDGFKAAMDCLSNIIKVQTNALNVSVETEGPIGNI